MKQIGVGIIGLGIMGKRMMAALEAHPLFHVAGYFDPAKPAGVSVASFDTVDALIAEPRVDLVYIAAPPAHHLAAVKKVTAAGKPVLCEKPLASSIADARECAALVAKSGVASAVNFYLAGGDAGVRMRRFIRGGALGKIDSAELMLRFREWPRPWQKGAGQWLALPEEGGFTREVMSHFLFQMHRIFGPGKIETVDVMRGPLGTETSVQARISFADVDLTIDAQIAGNIDDQNRLLVRGKKASIAIVDWSELEVRGATISEAALPGTFMLDSLAALLSGQPTELATFAEAAHVVELTETLVAR